MTLKALRVVLVSRYGVCSDPTTSGGTFFYLVPGTHNLHSLRSAVILK